MLTSMHSLSASNCNWAHQLQTGEQAWAGHGFNFQRVDALHGKPEGGVLKGCTPHSSHHHHLEGQELQQALTHV